MEGKERGSESRGFQRKKGGKVPSDGTSRWGTRLGGGERTIYSMQGRMAIGGADWGNKEGSERKGNDAWGPTGKKETGWEKKTY